LLGRLEASGLTNVRVAEADAVRLLRERLAPASLAGVRLFFPDPWPKTRHVKRRLVTASFGDLVASRLRPGGVLHVVTDVPAYAEQVREVLAAHPAFALDDGLPPARMTTRFERQALAAGRKAIELVGLLRQPAAEERDNGAVGRSQMSHVSRTVGRPISEQPSD
jgi:tRNA (guanine-N7-)-methyltransferase